MTAKTVPEPTSETVSEEQELDFERLKQIAALFCRAPRRRPRLAALSLLGTLLIGVGIAAFAPRAFECSAGILAQRNLMLPALDNPSRAVPREADSPTKDAAATIMQRDNIVAIIKQLDLMDRWEATRQPILRLKDKLTLALLGPRSDDDRMLDMVGYLQKQISVVSDDANINIKVQWPDRELAFEIVDFLQRGFLTARFDSNVNIITEAIRILEERAKPQAAEVDAALTELTRIEMQRKGLSGHPGTSPPTASDGHHSPGLRTPSAPVARPSTGDEASGGVAEDLADVRRRIQVAKEDHERQLMQAKNQLADARTTLGPMHPTVMALNDRIAQLSAAPPELAPLVARERQLLAQLARTSATAAPPPKSDASPPPATEATPETSTRGTSTDLRDDPEVALALSRVQNASAKYGEMLSRIEAANIELEVARAAFKYQYIVVQPAELPRKPSKPNVLLILLASVIFATIFTILVPGTMDLLGGRFVEEWQLERKLGLPLLGALKAPY
jgi:uncharacterized protein involved in exopolysaccharide biosynthesis